MIYLFYGNGKGKTTASLGQALRAVGDGKRVFMIQFIKGPWRSGEDEVFAKFQIPKSKFQIVKMGKGFVGILGDKLPRSEHENAAKAALKKAWSEIKPEKHLILTGYARHEPLVKLADLVTEVKMIKHPYYKGVEAKKGLDY